MSAEKGVLLIGGNGFVGRALADALAAEGRMVHVLSRHAETGTDRGITFHEGGQDHPRLVPTLLKRCDTVVHLASTTTPGSSARHPTVDTEENLLPASRLAELMTASPPRRFIFLSSGGSIYGDPERLPVDESTLPRPLSYHAAGKLALECAFSAFAHASKVSFAILRPSNLYGPGQSLRQGFGLVRTLLDKASRREPVEVWGDGNALRDYLYIDDAVDAVTRLIDRPEAQGVFNLGCGVGTSILDMIRAAERITGRTIPTVMRAARGTDVRAIVLDSGRLKEATGWHPGTSLHEGLQTTWAWIQNGPQ